MHTAAEHESAAGQGHAIPRPKGVFPNYSASHLGAMCFVTSPCDNTDAPRLTRGYVPVNPLKVENIKSKMHLIPQMH